MLRHVPVHASLGMFITWQQSDHSPIRAELWSTTYTHTPCVRLLRAPVLQLGASVQRSSRPDMSLNVSQIPLTTCGTRRIEGRARKPSLRGAPPTHPTLVTAPGSFLLGRTKLRNDWHAGRKVACRATEEVLELSEENIDQALQDARQELMQLFDESVGMTGTVQLAELDGPFVKLRLQGRFWHKRADVLARVAAYVQRRIPDILEVDIEDEVQLDDSEAQF